MPTARQTADLVARIYDAALDVSCWPEVLSELCGAMSGNIAALGAVVHGDQSGGRSPFSVSPSTVIVGLDASTFTAYTTHYGLIDPLLPRALGRPLGTVTTLDSLGERAAAEKSAFFIEWARPLGMRDNAFVPLLHEPGAVWLLSVSRAPDAPPYRGDDMRALAVIASHVQRALQLRLRLGQAQAERDRALDAIPHETVLVDAAGRVVHANSAASRRLASGDGLGVAGNRISARTAAETSALTRLIAKAADPWSSTQPGGYLRLSRRPPKEPLVVFIAPVQRSSAWQGASGAVAMLLVSDPQDAPPSRIDVLRRLYRLTPAEARLAELLLHNRTLHEVADLHAVTVETVRSQLKQVFAKTETHRQSELLRLLLRLPGISEAGPPAEAGR